MFLSQRAPSIFGSRIHYKAKPPYNILGYDSAPQTMLFKTSLETHSYSKHQRISECECPAIDGSSTSPNSQTQGSQNIVEGAERN